MTSVVARSRIPMILAMIVLTYSVCEGASWIAYRIATGEWFSFDTVRDNLSSVRTPPHMEHKLPLAIHPYLGYTGNPDEVPGLNELGFLENERIPVNPESTEPPLNIVITGGSVAFFLYAQSRYTLVGKLWKLPKFRKRDVELIPLTLPGYKQPQQLFTLQYYFLSGGRADIVINLDGLNEVTPAAGAGVAATNYPNFWQQLTTNTSDWTQMESLVALYETSRFRRTVAGLSSPFDFSVTALTLWTLADKGLQIRINETHLSTVQDAGLPWFRRGPSRKLGKEESLRKLVETWAHSSRLMQSLSEFYGFTYFHFLQPNQYLDGTKPFTEAELALMRKPNRWASGVPDGYPQLIETGAELKRSGIQFTDLTRIFENNHDTIYMDECCHVTKAGNEVLAEHIADTLTDFYESADSLALK